MPPVARLGDICTGHGCWPPRANVEAAADVFVNDRGAHRVGDAWAAHTCPSIPETHAGALADGSSGVFVNGRPLGRIGDPVSCGSAVATGSHDVFAGARGSVGGMNTPPRFDPPERTCSVERIPGVMRANGWTVGAALLEQWFARPASTDRDALPDVWTVTMDWVLSFERAKSAYRRLTSPSAWYKITMKPLIFNEFIKRGYDGAAPMRIGFDAPVPQLAPHYVQYEAVGMSLPTPSPDDLDVALGAFTLRLILAGTVSPLGDGRHRVELDAIGVFVQDSFDFEGEQYLGDWDMVGNRIVPRYFGCPVSNGAFRDWRDRHGRGGDFRVYSDLRVAALPPGIYRYIADTRGGGLRIEEGGP